MKRALFACALLACSTQAIEPAPPDSGAFVPMGVVILDAPIVVVRGESTTIRVRALPTSSSGPSEATLGLGPLPVGVTATTATWHQGDTQDPTLVLSASADAPIAEISVEVHALANDFIIGSSKALLDVSNAAGSLDPTFGQGGVLVIEPSIYSFGGGIMVASDGSFIAAGMTYDQAPYGAFLARISADGTQQTFVKTAAPAGLPFASISSAAFSPDGRVALGVVTGTSGAVVLLDASGNMTWSSGFAELPPCVAWDGDAVLVCQTRNLVRVDASQQMSNAQNDIVPGALLVTAPGTALVGGRGNTGAEAARFVASNGALTEQGSWSMPGLDVYGMALDANGSILTMTTGGVIRRVLPTGTIDATYAPLITPFGVTPISVVPAASDALLVGSVVGTPKNTTVLARYDSSGALDTSFGTFGHAFSSAGNGLIPTAATLDATGTRLCTTGSEYVGTEVHAYLACYRLTSPP